MCMLIVCLIEKCSGSSAQYWKTGQMKQSDWRQFYYLQVCNCCFCSLSNLPQVLTKMCWSPTSKIYDIELRSCMHYMKRVHL